MNGVMHAAVSGSSSLDSVAGGASNATYGAGSGAQAVGMTDETKGLLLALSSSIFIGSSFIIKKKGLRLAALTGVRAGAGGYSYLMQPLWWLGTLTMVFGEIFNFAAYAFAPAVLVTPLGAISIIVSAVLAHFLLKEKLHYLGWMGCLICIMGSLNVVMNAPAERALESMPQVWSLAMQPEFLLYIVFVLVSVAVLVSLAREHGNSNVLVYIGICSLMGSLSVMSVKALGIALKLTFVEGDNQFVYKETGFCVVFVAVCVITQINYLNKALDTFNTAVVSPIYYVFFTSFTIIASTIMFKDWVTQTGAQLTLELTGFITILCGTALLHLTKDYDGGNLYTSLAKGCGELPVKVLKPEL